MAMPEGLRMAGFPFWVSTHRPLSREKQRFLASLEMTIRESDVSWSQSLSLLVTSHKRSQIPSHLFLTTL